MSIFTRFTKRLLAVKQNIEITYILATITGNCAGIARRMQKLKKELITLL